MRRSILAVAVLATGIVTALPTPAQAYWPFGKTQFYGQGYGGDHGGGYGQPDWHQRREWRQQHDEARIAEAARAEAWRIQQEREQRRQWRRAHREQFEGGGYRNW